MDSTVDIQTITDAGFDQYLNRLPIKRSSVSLPRYINAQNLVQGIIGKEGILYLGSLQIKIDGKNQRILVNDGTTDVVLIGKF